VSGSAASFLTKLVLEIPTKVRQVVAPIEFKDLALP
jgi:hypothetical protein